MTEPMSIMNLKFKYTTDSNPFYIEFMFEKLNESMLLNFVKKSIQVSKIHFEMSFPIFSGFSCFCWTWVQAVQRDRVQIQFAYDDMFWRALSKREHFFFVFRLGKKNVSFNQNFRLLFIICPSFHDNLGSF